MMKGLSLFQMLEIAAGLSMAGPMFIVGVEFLRTGELPLGILMLTFGVVALCFPSYLIRKIGGPRTWIRRRFSRAGDDTDTTDTDSDADRSSLRDWIRSR